MTTSSPISATLGVQFGRSNAVESMDGRSSGPAQVPEVRPSSPISMVLYQKISDFISATFAKLAIFLAKHTEFSAWFVVVASGIAVGLLRGVIGWLIGLGFDLRLSAMLYAAGSNHEVHFLSVFLAMGVVALVLAVVAAALVVFVAPAATGGGVADIKATLNGIEAPSQLFELRAFVVRCLTIPLSSASGLIIGFEAPMTHMGALVTVLVTMRLTGVRPFGKQLTDLVTIGTAMGSCAAFITPLCGFLMVREELSLHWDNSLAVKTGLGCLIAAQTARFMRAITTCGFSDLGCMGVGGVIRFDTGESELLFSPKEMSCLIVIGILGGVLGAGISVVTWYRAQLVKHRKTDPSFKVAWAGLAVVLACSCYMAIAVADGCVTHVGHVSGTSGLAEALCPEEGQVNPAALILFEPRYPAVKAVFSSAAGLISPGVLLGCVLSIFASMACVLSMQVPYGLVFPHILMGACMGRLVGDMFGVSAGVSALLGVSSALAGLRRTVVPIVILTVELTGNVTNIIPMVAVTLIAKWVGDSLYLRQFDVVIKLKGYPVMSSLNRRLQQLLSGLKVKDIMSAPVISIKVGENTEEVTKLLNSTAHSLFPVMSSEGSRVLGLISRDELIRVMPKSPTEVLEVTEASLEDPLFINMHTSFCSTYKNFRNLGLKSMLVLDNDGRLAGILTRTSFVQVMNDPERFMIQ